MNSKKSDVSIFQSRKRDQEEVLELIEKEKSDLRKLFDLDNSDGSIFKSNKDEIFKRESNKSKKKIE
jgi:hypothetical protein